jgi:hypothetical protein
MKIGSVEPPKLFEHPGLLLVLAGLSIAAIISYSIRHIRTEALRSLSPVVPTPHRLIYAAKNFLEIGWLEILPKEEGK